MKHIFIAIVAVILFPSVAFAQQSPFGDRPNRELPTSETGFYSPPALFVDGITIPTVAQVSGSAFSGSFHVLSMEDTTISDIKYRIELISPRTSAGEQNTVTEDAVTVYDSMLASDAFILTPNEQKDIPFSYTVPAVPGGAYRLRIQLMNSQGKEFGWDDADIAIAANDITYAQLLPGAMTIAEYGTQAFSPTSGPNITPEKPFVIHAVATLLGSTKASFIPVVTIGSETRSLPTIVLQPNIATPLEIPMTAPVKPGVYVASLMLQNSTSTTKASPVVQYRFIVRGTGANIIALRLNAVGITQGETIETQIDMVGSADAETTVRASLVFEAVDADGVAGTLRVPETVVLTDAVASGTAKVTLDRNLGADATLKATLTDESGAVLSTYTVPLPSGDALASVQVRELSSDAPKTKRGVLIGVLAIVLIGLVAYAAKRRKAAALPIAVALLAIAASSAYAGNGITLSTSRTGAQYGGDWTPLGTTPFVEMFINRPIHNAATGTYQKDGIPLEFRMNYASCNNRLGGAFVYADYLQNGGKISSIDAPAGNAWVRSWWSNRQFLKNCPEDAGCGVYKGGQVYLNTGMYSGVFNFDRLSATVSDTTFRIAAIWSWNMTAHADKFSSTTVITPTIPSSSNVVERMDRNIVALWVNFTPPPTPTSTPAPTPTLTPTPSQSPTPVPQPVTVNLLINGSDTPAPVSVNTPITLSWASVNADTCSATGDWTGSKVATGSEATTPTQIRTYTYTITCTNTVSGLTGSDTGSIAVNAFAGDVNRAPIANAGMLINGQLSTFASPISVTQGQQVSVQLVATGSDDPDGWTHATRGVATGGKCEWNSNLSPDGSIDTVIPNPASPASCDISDLASVVGYPIVFNDPVGTYTYNLLRITDALGASSPIAQVRVTVVAPTYQCNDTEDNDGDGLVNTNDPGCHTDGNPSNSSSYDPTDNDETHTAVAPTNQCSDTSDNDGDGLADNEDPGCHIGNDLGQPYVPTDNDEANSSGPGNGNGSGGFQETR